MTGATIVGVFLDMPAFVLLSIYAFALSVITILPWNDNVVLNSLAIPLLFPVACVAIVDVFPLNNAFFLHAVTAVLVAIIMLRKKTSVIIMASASLLYGAWIFTLKYYGIVPAYDCVLGFCDPLLQAAFVTIGSLGVSTTITVLNFGWKARGHDPGCPPPFCPI
jgi:hypothetical protein